MSRQCTRFADISYDDIQSLRRIQKIMLDKIGLQHHLVFHKHARACRRAHIVTHHSTAWSVGRAGFEISQMCITACMMCSVESVQSSGFFPLVSMSCLKSFRKMKCFDMSVARMIEMINRRICTRNGVSQSHDTWMSCLKSWRKMRCLDLQQV